MSRAPSEFRNFPDPLAKLTTLGGCPYGPYRAISRFDPRWDDGDTALVMLDVGADQYPIQSIRFLGVNAPEKATVEGRQVQAGMANHIMPAGLPLAIVTSWEGKGFGRDKYGRLLAVVFRVSTNMPDRVVCLNTQLVYAGQAQKYLEWDLANAIADGVYRWAAP